MKISYLLLTYAKIYRSSIKTRWLIFMISFSVPLFAQYEPDKYLHSPEVATFNKNFDIPVSYYSGTANISIPIYNISFEGITIPISLTYNSSGIRVSEEASWVGLGWNLAAGGQISKTTRGKDDFDPQGYVNKHNLMPDYNQFTSVYSSLGYDWRILDINTNLTPLPPFPSSGYLQFLHYDFMYNGQNRNYYYDFTTGGGLSVADFESDLYNLSIPGYSVQFFFDRDMKPILVEKKDIKIELTGSNFKVTTPNGYIYHFNKEMIGATLDGKPYISSWLLTSITNPRNTNSINFNYSANKSIQQFSYGKTRTYNLLGSDLPQTDENPVTISTCTVNYLDNITFDNNTIFFDLDNTVINPREDLDNAERLEKIRVVNSNNEVVRSFKFVYSYFESNGDGPGYESYVLSKGYLLSNKRLKLDEVIDDGKPPYKFSYVTNTMPPKTTYGQDFWGYYNGAQNSGLIPECTYDDVKYAGANRKPNPTNVKVGLLNEIIYPTGGKTNFEYEINRATDYDWQYIPYSFDYYEGANLPTREGYSSAITQTKNCIINPQIFIFNYLSTNFRPGQFITLAIARKSGCSGTHKLLRFYLKQDTNNAANLVFDYCEDEGTRVLYGKISLLPGEYFLTRNTSSITSDWGYLPESFPPITTPHIFSVSFTYNEKVMDPSVLINGPGVRIKKIVSSDNVTGKNILKTFEYTNGILLTPPKFYQNEGWNYDPANNFSPLVLYSNSVNHLSTSSGSYVGYGQVAEYQEENTAQASLKTVYQYHNNESYGCPIIFGFQVPSIDKPLNGYLNMQSSYTKVNGIWKVVKELINNYTANDASITPMLAYWVKHSSQGGDDATFATIYGASSAFIKLNSSTENTYSSASDDNVSVKTDYTYNNNLGYFGVSETVTKTSGDKELKVKTLYPYNYSAGEMEMTSVLKKAYMLLPIEKYTILGIDKVISGSLMKYRTGSFIGLMDEVYELENTKEGLKLGVDFNPSNISGSLSLNSYYKRRLKYDNYDVVGNISQLHKENDLFTSYLWSYNQTYPVVKGDNVTYDILNSAVSAAAATNLEIFWSSFNDITTNTAQQAAWKNFNTTLRSNASLANAQISTYTYKPLLGITSQTDPNGKTTYYEYDTFGRLKLIRDDQNNILKKIDYHYSTQN